MTTRPDNPTNTTPPGILADELERLLAGSNPRLGSWVKLNGRKLLTTLRSQRDLIEEAAKELGRFGHHPEAAIDFCIEVESLENIATDKELGLRTDDPVPVDRWNKAMDFRVGGDVQAVNAKHALRQLEPRIRALSTSTPSPKPNEAGVGAYGPTFRFKRYVDGAEMAEGICIKREQTLEAAILRAVRICPYAARHTVLVLDATPPAAGGNSERVDALIDMIISAYHTTRVADVPAAQHIRSKLGDRLTNAIAALGVSTPSPVTERGWQPIETAPKDGTEFDAWVPSQFGGHRMADMSFNARGQLRQRCSLEAADVPRWPTHWQPLPEPPSRERESEQ